MQVELRSGRIGNNAAVLIIICENQFPSDKKQGRSLRNNKKIDDHETVIGIMNAEAN